jgi:hypothetical protein
VDELDMWSKGGIEVEGVGVEVGGGEIDVGVGFDVETGRDGGETIVVIEITGVGGVVGVSYNVGDD